MKAGSLILLHNPAFLLTLASVAAVSLLSLVGLALIPLGHQRLHSIVFILVSLAVGALFGDAFLHLLPEAFAAQGAGLKVPLLVLLGLYLFFVLEHILHWHHHHVEDHEHGDPGSIEPYGYMNLIADILHNFIDGLLVGASYQVDTQIGLATTAAVLLHELPHEAGNFGILIHAGFSRNRALFLNFLTALSAIAGGVAAWVLAGGLGGGFVQDLVPFTAGGFLYIAGSDLVPQLQKESRPGRAFVQLAAILTGTGLMVLLKLWE